MIYRIRLNNKFTNQPVHCYITAPNVFTAIGKLANILQYPDNYDVVYAVPYKQD